MSISYLVVYVSVNHCSFTEVVLVLVCRYLVCKVPYCCHHNGDVILSRGWWFRVVRVLALEPHLLLEQWRIQANSNVRGNRLFRLPQFRTWLWRLLEPCNGNKVCKDTTYINNAWGNSRPLILQPFRTRSMDNSRRTNTLGCSRNTQGNRSWNSCWSWAGGGC